MEPCVTTSNSRVIEKISAWAYLFGNHGFNKFPFALSGTKVVLRSKPDNQESYAHHGKKGWYAAPAPSNYRRITIYMHTTHRERITDMVELILHNNPIPEATIEDHLRRVTYDIMHLLHTNTYNY